MLDDREGVVAMGIFPLISMLNHSCEPNLRPIIEKGFELEFVALRDIAEGANAPFIVFVALPPVHATWVHVWPLVCRRRRG